MQATSLTIKLRCRTVLFLLKRRWRSLHKSLKDSKPSIQKDIFTEISNPKTCWWKTTATGM